MIAAIECIWMGNELSPNALFACVHMITQGCLLHFFLFIVHVLIVLVLILVIILVLILECVCVCVYICWYPELRLQLRKSVYWICEIDLHPDNLFKYQTKVYVFAKISNYIEWIYNDDASDDALSAVCTYSTQHTVYGLNTYYFGYCNVMLSLFIARNS